MPSVFADDLSALHQTVDTEAVLYQLGAWLAGLESFLSVDGQSFTDKNASQATQTSPKEIRIARSALQRCSHLCFVLIDTLSTNGGSVALSLADIRKFSATLREPLLLADGLINSSSAGAGEWRAWSDVVLERFRSDQTFTTLVAIADAGASNFLPEKLKRLVSDATSSAQIKKELDVILPRFGKILRMLDIVGELLERDEPLKPALLIFSKVAEQTQELVSYLNQRVNRVGEDAGGFLDVLDGASYTASIELKKVVQQELAGVTSLRPATSIYARTETAYALLTESFQQILAQFARQIDPAIDIFELFPNFRNKLDQSIILRKELHLIAQIVRLTEKEPDGGNAEKLNGALIRFMEKTVRFLFYKDIETVERFVEEILVTKQKKDLVPIVHRFGAYLETLFAQVNMRAVLENHPFETEK